MTKIFCFGELLLRMSPRLGGEWIRDSAMDVYLGGAELNVASALARWKLPVQYGTVLPDHYLSSEILSQLSILGIDHSPVLFSGSRIGLYYLPQGADLKHAGVIYDRANSSFYSLKPGMIDWDRVLEGISWFHFSAISPALTSDLAAVCEEALTTAAKKNITISCDLNYRARLWQYGKKPPEIMPALIRYCDVVMGNIWSAHSLLGIDLRENIHTEKDNLVYQDHARQTAMLLMQRFPKCKTIAQTFRFDRDGAITYFGTLDQDSRQFVSGEYFQPSIIDKVGTGDCFMAGLIYGLVHQKPLEEVIDFAAAAAVGKFLERGDASSQTIEAVEETRQKKIFKIPK